MVPRSETLIVASSFGQACIAFEHVVAFMGDKLKDRQPLAPVAVRAVGADRRQGDRRNREVPWAAIPGARARFGAVARACRRAEPMADKVLATGCWRRSARRRASNPIRGSWQSAPGRAAHDHWFSRMLDGRRRLRPNATRRTEEATTPFRTQDVDAKANPSISAYAGPRKDYPQGSGRGAIRRNGVSAIPGVETERRDFRFRSRGAAA